MLIWNQSKLTTAGKALLAKAQAGQTSIQITKAQTGSGSYSSGENLESRTALKTPKQTFPIQSKSISDADNPQLAWSKMESKSFWDSFGDYEKLGGNGFMHSEVQPAMNRLEEIEMDDTERLVELYASRKS